MESRKTIEERITIKIGKQFAETYKNPYTWKDLMETDKVLPTDTVYNFCYVEEKENGFGSMKMEDKLDDYYYPAIVVIRPRPETDDEYLKRKQQEQVYSKQTEEREKLEYLRLKAKFEVNE